jgi:hypothetical protein
LLFILNSFASDLGNITFPPFSTLQWILMHKSITVSSYLNILCSSSEYHKWKLHGLLESSLGSNTTSHRPLSTEQINPNPKQSQEALDLRCECQRICSYMLKSLYLLLSSTYHMLKTTSNFLNFAFLYAIFKCGLHSFFFFFIYLFIFIILLFICAYKAWVISPPCPHPLPYHPLCPLPLPAPYPAETILPLFLILL